MLFCFSFSYLKQRTLFEGAGVGIIHHLDNFCYSAVSSSNPCMTCSDSTPGNELP